MHIPWGTVCCWLICSIKCKSLGYCAIGPLVYVIPTIHGCSITCYVLALPQHVFCSKPGLQTISMCAKKIVPKADSKSVPPTYTVSYQEVYRCYQHFGGFSIVMYGTTKSAVYLHSYQTFLSYTMTYVRV